MTNFNILSFDYEICLIFWACNFKIKGLRTFFWFPFSLIFSSSWLSLTSTYVDVVSFGVGANICKSLQMIFWLRCIENDYIFKLQHSIPVLASHYCLSSTFYGQRKLCLVLFSKSTDVFGKLVLSLSLFWTFSVVDTETFIRRCPLTA